MVKKNCDYGFQRYILATLHNYMMGFGKQLKYYKHAVGIETRHNICH